MMQKKKVESLNLKGFDALSPKQAGKIFTNSSWDWNGKGVDKQRLIQIIRKMEQCPQHRFLLLSKFPAGFARFDFPLNVWLGTSVATTADRQRIKDLSDLDVDNDKFLLIELIGQNIELRLFGGEIKWVFVKGQATQKKK